MTDNKSILNAKNLSVGYGRKVVVSNINVEALKGQVICLLGPNGAGKTTILRTISGLLAAVDGTVEIAGMNIEKSGSKEIAKKLSVVLTEQNIPSLTTVFELVSMGRMPYTDFLGRLSKNDRIIVDNALKTVGADSLKERYVSQLSDGEKQKIMIARALVQEPELIILDEPTSHLDIRHKIEVISVLQKLSYNGITCILSLHDIDLAIKGCQTVLLVNGSEIIGQGSPEEIVKSGVIGKLYNIHGAEYNELLGSVELKGKDANDVFVVGGNASGIRIYRALSRCGYGLTSGVIHENDTDYEVAKTICSKVVSERPFEKISLKMLEEAKQLMKSSVCVVDSGFLVGIGNNENIELIKFAVEIGKTVFSLRSEIEIIERFGEYSKKIICLNGIKELISAIISEYAVKP